VKAIFLDWIQRLNSFLNLYSTENLRYFNRKGFDEGQWNWFIKVVRWCAGNLGVNSKYVW
jgi:hypothetical protein